MPAWGVRQLTDKKNTAPSAGSASLDEAIAERGFIDLRDVSSEIDGSQTAAHAQRAIDLPAPSLARHRYRILALYIGATDALCIIAALLLAYFVRFGTRPMPGDYLLLMLGAPLVWVAIFQGASLYSIRQLSAWEEFRRLLIATSIGIVLVIVGNFWSKAEFSRILIGLSWSFALVLELATRRAWRAYIYKLKEYGHLSLRTLIVGTKEEARRIADRFGKKASGFLPIGHISVGHSAPPDDEIPLVGEIDDLSIVIPELAADSVFVASSEADDKAMLKVAQAARQQNAEIWISAQLPEVLSSRLRVQPIADVMALSLKPVRLTGPQVLMKRTFDIVAGGLGLLLACPLLIGIAIAIKGTSRGGVLFTQRRVTRGGHVFLMYKFRTMRRDADRVLEERGIDPTAPFFKLGEDDPRLTRVGRVLRKWSLDELPQLFNVVKGEMSLVGPRPLPAEQVANNLNLLGPRHEVKAGMTGWWQIQGRSELRPEEAVRLDLFYIENWSLALDLFILLKTAGAVIAKKGAM